MLHTTLPRVARTAASAAVLACSLLLATACGSGVEPPAPRSAAASDPVQAAPDPVQATTSAAAPSSAAARPSPRPTTPALPWPAGDAAAVSSLQANTDSGGQPWLLDPLDVAQAYATAVHGWRTATVGSVGPDRIRISDGGAAVLVTVGQPARTGSGGIWVVTGERPA